METGDPNRTVKNSLNYVSTCLRVVDTRRLSRGLPVAEFAQADRIIEPIPEKPGELAERIEPIEPIVPR